MATAQTGSSARNSFAVPRAADWEMISSFMLTLPGDQPAVMDCLLEPVANALKPFGIEDKFLCEISSAIEATGEELRKNCPAGKLNCVNVRVHISRQTLRAVGKTEQPWSFFLIQQIASSESDNLDAFENPRCYIDLYVQKTI